MQEEQTHRISVGDITVWPQGSAGATDDLLPDGGFGYLNEQVIWFRHEAMKDSRSALRVPEGVHWTTKRRVDDHRPERHNYQIGQDWQKRRNALLYESCPITTPLDPSPGTISATVDSAPDNLVLVRMTLANTSEQPLDAVICHFCFNHRRAPLLGRNIIAASTDGWVDFNQYVASEPFRGYNFNGKDNPQQLPAITHPILLSETVFQDGGSFVSAIGSESACAISSNVEWPCTDINVSFGTIDPGQSSTRDIFIGLGPGTKEEWFDRLLRQFSCMSDSRQPTDADDA